MELTFGSRLKNAWNAFVKNKDPTRVDTGPGYYYRPDRPRLTRGSDRSIVTAVYNRIALDASAIDIRHVRLDDNERYIGTIQSNMNTCFSLAANADQTGRAFFQDVVMSMLDEGAIAIAPIDTSFDPEISGAYDILSMRVGRIVSWYPQHVKLNVYNERTGEKEDVIFQKSSVAIIENPLYAVINEPNSTMQRLIRKLALLDMVDEQNSSGKLDLIIQLPYVIKTETRKQQAEERRQDIVNQLTGSKYGIAYTDGTERITQLNRPVENNLMSQVEYLTSMLYSQLGLTPEILNGTADEKTMLNYYNRTIEPILSAIVDSMKWKFLTKTARSQKQSIAFFRDPFSLVPAADLAEIADKMTRNEIMSSNEIRQIIGLMPDADPKSDRLQNSNLYQNENENDESIENVEDTDQQIIDDPPPSQEDLDLLVEAYGGLTEEETGMAINDLDALDKQLDELEGLLEQEIKHYASPYYDPVKAHEYYMRTRELKGRRSTAGLNAEGKNAARYVKEQLNTERKAKVEAHKKKTDQSIEGHRQLKKSMTSTWRESTKISIDNMREQKKNKVAAHKEATQSRIDRLRERLKNMDPIERDRHKNSIYDEIDSLRASNKAERNRLTEEFKKSSSALREATKRNIAGAQEDFKNTSSRLRTEHKNEKNRLKQEYDAKYEQELSRIHAESGFQQVKRSKK